MLVCLFVCNLILLRFFYLAKHIYIDISVAPPGFFNWRGKVGRGLGSKIFSDHALYLGYRCDQRPFQRLK